LWLPWLNKPSIVPLPSIIIIIIINNNNKQDATSATTDMGDGIEEIFDDTEGTEDDWMSESAPARLSQDGITKERLQDKLPPTKPTTLPAVLVEEEEDGDEGDGDGDGEDPKEEKTESTTAAGEGEAAPEAGTKKGPMFLAERRAERMDRPKGTASPPLGLDRASTAPVNTSSFGSTSNNDRRISMPHPDVSARNLNGGKPKKRQSQAHPPDDRFALLSAQMVHNQEQTVAALNDLSQTMKNLIKTQLRRDKEAEDDGKDLLNVDRATVRLDGLEVYAVVSALTVATAIACFDLYGSGSNVDMTTIFIAKDITWENITPLVLNTIFLAVSGVGIIAGLHATLVFSLMTMYGRTAVGVR
jgi:hypothetical protein